MRAHSPIRLIRSYGIRVDLIEQREAVLGVGRLGMCRRATDGGAERRRYLHELIVEARDGAPVRASAVSTFRVYRLNRCFDLKSSQPRIASRCDQLALGFFDQRRE